VIGYYVHHQGNGHVTRARAIAAHLDDEVVAGLSSRSRPDDWAGPWLRLARDDDAEVAGDVTAGGALHWAPPGHAGLRERMAQLAAWIVTYTPRLLVVDVSVEVAVLARTMGVPTIVIGMPGVREDRAHQLGYQLADAIIAPWPEWAAVLRGAEPFAAKLHAVGAISRFDGREPVATTGRAAAAADVTAPADGAAATLDAAATATDAAAAAHAATTAPAAAPAAPAGGARGGPRRVVVLSGRGGSDLTPGMLADAARATPGWAWTVLGPPSDRWVDDPWPLLCAADVIVTHAGQNAIADVAAAGRPAVVVPQPRPYDEQHATARVLAEAGVATVRARWPEPHEWDAVLGEALARGGEGWTRWRTGTGAERAAALLRERAWTPR